MEGNEKVVTPEDTAAVQEGTASGEENVSKAAESPADKKDSQSYDETYVNNLRAEMEEKQRQAVEEALKKERMTAEEKAKYEADKKQEDITRRESELMLRELKADTKDMLLKENLPVEFVDMVVGKDAEETKKNIASFKTAFDAAVQEKVEARVKGTTPSTGSGAGKAGVSDMEAQMNQILGL